MPSCYQHLAPATLGHTLTIVLAGGSAPQTPRNSRHVACPIHMFLKQFIISIHFPGRPHADYYGGSAGRDPQVTKSKELLYCWPSVAGSHHTFRSFETVAPSDGP